MNFAGICSRRIALAIMASVSVFLGGGNAAYSSGNASKQILPLPDVNQRKHFETDPAIRELLPKEIIDRGVLRVAASTSQIPYSYFSESNTLEWLGFDAEIFIAISELWGVKVETTPVENAQLLLGVNSGRYDLGMGNMGETKLRRQKVDFVDYRWNNFALAVRKGSSISKLADICGKSAILYAGSPAYDAAVNKVCQQAGLKPTSIYLLPDNGSAVMALQSGRVEAYLTQVPEVKAQINAGLPFDFIEVPDIGRMTIGVVTPIGATKLQGAILAGIKKLQANGYYDEVLNRWGVGELSDHEPGVNVGSDKTPLWNQ